MEPVRTTLLPSLQMYLQWPNKNKQKVKTCTDDISRCPIAQIDKQEYYGSNKLKNPAKNNLLYMLYRL